MSLESEIVKLTEAVQALTSQLNGLTLPAPQTAVAAPEPKPAPKAKVEPKAEPKGDPAITQQDLVDLCIEVSRAKIGVNNKKIRTLMQSYGECGVVKDIPVEHWADFKAKLEALRDE